MLMADGVELIEAKDHLQAAQHLEDLAGNPAVAVHIVNAYHSSWFAAPEDVVRAIALSMGLNEWYGYDPEYVIGQGLGMHGHDAHIIALVIHPGQLRLLSPLVPAFQRAHYHAYPKRFWTLIFPAPLPSGNPRL